MPATPATPPPADFGAPTGKRVRTMGAVVVGVIGMAVIFNLGVALSRRVPSRLVWGITFAPLIGLAAVVPIYLRAQIRGYRLADGQLHVLRRGRRRTSFPLADLRGVEADRTAMERSAKVFGNDGLGAITGQFSNQKLGEYEALATDGERAVVLRWPNRCLVVSPDRPTEFVEAVRTRAGLRR